MDLYQRGSAACLQAVKKANRGKNPIPPWIDKAFVYKWFIMGYKLGYKRAIEDRDWEDAKCATE